jgi:anti-anti-sigma regulatory factor
MFSMTALSHAADCVTLALAGSVNAEVLSEIERLIDNGRRMQGHVVLDLSEVTLMDRTAARFFAGRLQEGVELVNCPLYLEPWILRETIHER